MPDKSFFRKECLQKRKKQDWKESARCICGHLEEFFRKNCFERVGFYYPIQNEIDLREVLIRLKEEKVIKTLALPRIRQKKMQFLRWEASSVLDNDDTGIPAPISGEIISPQCLLIPCVGIDPNGYRLGYGGGWYDRLLAQDTFDITIGVLSREFLLPSIPHEVHDRPLSAFVNENGFTWVKPSRSELFSAKN